ncbi:uncharacterized protein MONBRDRAFT_38045 [Monosiga brevicollis MX1]|uniref:sphingolipid 4-desaturase n=1 Tax=Monosiga brevicollis TaxID=81824 RepID=A9V5D6_MONBE|nr:uncharacterized protein MONBRDRAFT_38045 [Monosiga brevicollis MX1]EDQ87263.1 predicted protein [Monosiga brevicollis MX1]|eukprot:XP_001747876.1 hypothetical protein [Monosiga brevicollis MX1]
MFGSPLKLPPLFIKEQEDKATMMKVHTREENDFYWDKDNEPHQERRKRILAAHPEIKTLMGPCPRTKWVVLATVLFQFAMASVASNWSFPVLLVLTYAVSGVLNHMMMLGVHEIAHNLAFKTPLYNRWLAILATVPIGLPVANSFRRYHLEHHKYQGEHDVDVDIPLPGEAWFFNSTIGKAVWMVLQPFFYALRPMFMRPKVPGPWEFTNIIVNVAYDSMLYYFFGWQALFYCIGGSLLGSGLHPVAGHFVSEHYVFLPTHETYSYYGPLNFVTFNVGYHNEHHDFANIPGSRLPQLKAMAPEFYDNLPYYTSWSGVIIDYILNAEMTPFSRVKRKTLSPSLMQEISEREARTQRWW